MNTNQTITLTSAEELELQVFGGSENAIEAYQAALRIEKEIYTNFCYYFDFWFPNPRSINQKKYTTLQDEAKENPAYLPFLTFVSHNENLEEGSIASADEIDERFSKMKRRIYLLKKKIASLESISN